MSIVATRDSVSELDELHHVALVNELLFGRLHDAFLSRERRSKLAGIAAKLYLSPNDISMRRISPAAHRGARGVLREQREQIAGRAERPHRA